MLIIREFNSILLKRILIEKNPNNFLLITTVTLTSYNEFEKKFNSNKGFFISFYLMIFVINRKLF